MVLRFTQLGLLVSLLGAIAAAQTQSAPDVSTIVARMLAAQQQNRMHARPLTVKRDYQLLDKKSDPKARIIADITFLPPNQKQYEIESSQGGMGEKILRDVLTKDTEPRKDKDLQRSELSPENYDFQLVGQETLDGRPCYVLSMTPRREAKALIHGQLWVDSETFLVHRIAGKPAKNPSWWIRDLYILMTFADVDGMWLRTFTHAVATVRFKGEYVMVSRDLEYHSPVRQAAHNRRNPGILAGAALRP